MTFDANSFMQSVTTDANSTSMPLTPPGEYTGVINKVEFKDGIIKNGARAGQPWYQLRVGIETSDPAALAGTDLPKRTVNGSIMLDLTESGGLATGEGKNIGLGRLREAVGLNEKGKPFAPAMLEGRSLRFEVSHRVDPSDASKIYEEIKAFRPL
jgi:hypothetical protein